MRCLCFLTAAVFATLIAPARGDFKPVGINPAFVNYYSTEHPFKDLMRQADAWRRGSTIIPADDSHLDADGWVKQVDPGEYYSTYLLWDLNYPAGSNPSGYSYLGDSNLVLHYEGEGLMTFGGGYHFVSQDAVNRRIVLAPNGGVTPTQGLEVKIWGVNSSNYLRNITVTKQEFENDLTDPWDPQFLSNWQSMRAVRFMDWGQTNNNQAATWSDRTPPNYFTQQGRNVPSDPQYANSSLSPSGASYETMIDLCNRLDKDLWICVPHQADDDYVTQLAALISQRLEPDRNVYVEHSNEVWNSMFAQHQYAIDRANELIAQGQTQLDAGAGDFGKAIRYHGMRTKEIGQIFDGVLGANRVVTVLGAFQPNSWITQQELGRVPDTSTYWDAGIKDVVDAVAVANYIGISDDLEPTSVDEIFTDLFANGLPAAKLYNSAQRSIMQSIKPGMQLIAYEGGQSLGYDVEDPSLFIAANRDPQMEVLYNQLLADWYQVGGKLFMAYDSTRKYGQYGSWGLLESQGQDGSTAPKYRAVLNSAWELEADFNSNGPVDALDLAEWRGDFRINADSDADGDNDTDGADILIWQRQLGSAATSWNLIAVPEPTTSGFILFWLLPAIIRFRFVVANAGVGKVRRCEAVKLDLL